MTFSSHSQIITVFLSRSKYPESCQHIEEAWAAGFPIILTLSRFHTKINRRHSLRGIPTRAGLDRDEYPFACAAEGSTGAHVKYISPKDNRGSGSVIGQQLRPYPDGTQFRISIHN